MRKKMLERVGKVREEEEVVGQEAAVPLMTLKMCPGLRTMTERTRIVPRTASAIVTWT
jgi:hypothetical protein